MELTKKQLNQLKKRMPKGWAKILAEKCGCSEGHVRNVMKKERFSEVIVREAIELANKNRAEKSDLANKLKDAIK